MADTKISALTGVSAVVSTHELAVADSATKFSRKIAVSDLETFLGKTYIKTLGSDITGINSTSFTKATGLDQTLTSGTYWFDYHVIWYTNSTAITLYVTVNFSGTASTFVAEATMTENNTDASTGAMNQQHTLWGIKSGGAIRAPSNSATMIAPITADGSGSSNPMLYIIRGVITVSVSGDLQLYYASETTGSTQVLLGSSNLIVRKMN